MSPASTYHLSIAATTLFRCDESISLKRKHASIAVWIAASDSGVLEVRGRGVLGERRSAAGGAVVGSSCCGRVEMEALLASNEEEGAAAAPATLETLSAEMATRGAEEGLKEGAAASSFSSFLLLSLATSEVARRTSALICRERVFFGSFSKFFFCS